MTKNKYSFQFWFYYLWFLLFSYLSRHSCRTNQASSQCLKCHSVRKCANNQIHCKTVVTVCSWPNLGFLRGHCAKWQPVKSLRLENPTSVCLNSKHRLGFLCQHTFTSCTFSGGGFGWWGPFAMFTMLFRSDRRLCRSRSWSFCRCFLDVRKGAYVCSSSFFFSTAKSLFY